MSLTKSTSRTEVAFPCRITTWCTNRFPFSKTVTAKIALDRYSGKWRMNQLSPCGVMSNATIPLADRTQPLLKTSQIIHDSSAIITSNILHSSHISASFFHRFFTLKSLIINGSRDLILRTRLTLPELWLLHHISLDSERERWRNHTFTPEASENNTLNTCAEHVEDYKVGTEGPFHAQITGLTHHCSCGSTHLFPRLYLVNLSHPSFFQLVTPFPCPNSFCPILSGHGGEIFFNFKAMCLHEQGKRKCALLASCRRHLSPQCQPLSGRHPNRMGSPSPCWHHACT